MNKFLRTASMRRLLAAAAGLVVAIGGGTAIALAATSGGPVPPPKRLAAALRQAMRAKPISGISADITFTNNLIPSFELQGNGDPLLNGGPGHVWASNDGQLRVELYNDGGIDPEIVVTHHSWWIYDPTLNTIYKGTMPAQSGPSPHKKAALPTVGQIQAELNKLAAHLNLSGAIPTDTGGQATYTVTVSPKHDAGLLGQLQLAWDAYRGVPLQFAVYRHGDSTPVLAVAATGVSYGAIDPSVFAIPLPKGPHVENIATPASTPPAGSVTAGKRAEKGRRSARVTGVKAVAAKLSFKLSAPSSITGLPRQSVSLLDTGKQHGALVTYGQNLGGVAVIEEPATAGSQQKLNLTSGSGDHANGITLPTVTINGATGQELDTALGTIIRFTRGNVTYTVVGSLQPSLAEAAARAL